MEISPSDIKFALSYLTAVTLLWKVAGWTTRKQILVENFFSDVRSFMAQTASSINRIETNHLAHQQQSLDAIQAALSPSREYVEIVGEDQPKENPDVSL